MDVEINELQEQEYINSEQEKTRGYGYEDTNCEILTWYSGILA